MGNVNTCEETCQCIKKGNPNCALHLYWPKSCCTAANPCAIGQGDCEDDTGCLKGLTCKEDSCSTHGILRGLSDRSILGSDCCQKDSDNIQTIDDSHTITERHTTRKETSGDPNNGPGNVTWIAVSIGGFLFLISMLCVATFVAKRRKVRKKTECHERDESEDDHDGYDAAYGDVGIHTMSPAERSNEPSTFEAVTTVDNVYYEASNEM